MKRVRKSPFLYKKLRELDGAITYSDGNNGWFNPEIAKIVLDKMLKSVGCDVLFDSEGFLKQYKKIGFTENAENIKYYFHVYEHDDYSLLMLEQASKFGNYLQYKLNPFFVNKLNAEIVPFSLHKF